MKSTEVYAAIREELGPWLKSEGFKREKALLSWSRRHEDRYTVLWCQVSQDGWDHYAGSKFVVELQRSTAPEAGTASTARARFSQLLTEEQRGEVWRLQRQIIASLGRPPRTHPALQVSPGATHRYLQTFEVPPTAYGPNDDVWLRYAKPEHLHAWANLLRRVLPRCIDAIEAMRAG